MHRIQKRKATKKRYLHPMLPIALSHPRPPLLTRKPRLSQSTEHQGDPTTPQGLMGMLSYEEPMSMSINPIKCNETIAANFRKDIHSKYLLLIKEDGDEDAISNLEHTDFLLLWSTWKTIVKPSMHQYILEEKWETNPSRTPEEELLEHALEDYRNVLSKPFGFPKCVLILQQIPKFNLKLKA